MFAIFGLGIAEIIVLAFVGLLLLVVPVVIAMAATRRSRNQPPSEVARLRAEVEELRDEVERLKRGSTDIKA